MNPKLVEPAVIEALRLQFPRENAIELTGSLMTETAQAELGRRLEALHGGIVEEKLASFTVDVRSLRFINSSAIRVFINWIARAQTGRYKLVFLTDPLMTWHRLSFSVLQSLAPGSVQIVEASTSGAEEPSS